MINDERLREKKYTERERERCNEQRQREGGGFLAVNGVESEILRRRKRFAKLRTGQDECPKKPFF